MKMPGDKFIPSASREREVDRLLDASRRAAAGRGSSITELRPGHAIAKNETGADLGFGRPAMLYWLRPPINGGGAPLRDWDASKLMVKLGPAINCTSTASDFPYSVAVTTEPIADGATGIVALSGLAVAVVYPGVGGYYRPAASNVMTTSGWGWGRIVSEDASAGYGVVDLSAVKLVTKYQITSVSGGTINATIDVGHASSFADVVFDAHGIAAWQTTGDVGQCEWVGSQWQIINPWCAD